MSDNLTTLETISPNHSKWNDFFQLYQTAFPIEEQRSEKELIAMIGSPMFYPNIIKIEEEFVGLLNYWDFGTFFYIEHFAIIPPKRDMRIGAQTLHQFMEGRIVVLECDLPTDEIGKRRVRFYEKSGFQAFPFPYIQPPYSAHKVPVPMLLLTSSNDLSKPSFEEVRAKIAEYVY